MVGGTLRNDGLQVIVLRELEQRMVGFLAQHPRTELVAEPGEQRLQIWGQQGTQDGRDGRQVGLVSGRGICYNGHQITSCFCSWG
jgi:hypothetical protein